MKKQVYNFKEGNKSMRNTLGGKGANLAEMVNLGLPVPPGLTITTDACIEYLNNNNTLSEELKKEIFSELNVLEKQTNKIFGSRENPLLLSIRSGSRASMPGMMDTILNLGLNDEVAESLSKKMNNPRFVYDSYRRLIEMYSDVVEEIDKSKFSTVFDRVKEIKGITYDYELTGEDLKQIISLYKDIFYKEKGYHFPIEPQEQLFKSIEAVFKSWNNKRAITYRKMNNIPNDWGTAVNVQTMVYGNLNNNSLTGVLFTRNPSTGEAKLFGEFLTNAQGEDVVAGVRTPEEIENLQNIMPEVYDEILKICKKLEHHYKDMQDIEFTVEDGKLYILQTRNAKRTASSAIKIALDFLSEGLIDEKEALLQVDPKLFDQLLHPTFESVDSSLVIGKGLAASPGAASGKIYFSSVDAVEKSKTETVLLVREETSPEDIDGMIASSGILTLKGGMTSHAAVVARGMGKPCVSGSSDFKLENESLVTKDGEVLKKGDYISIDGSTGEVFKGKLETKEAELSVEFAKFISYADKYRTLKIRANADNEKGANLAIKLGAEGIGLCRSEHMFFEKERLFYFRKMIFAKDEEERNVALDELIVYQSSDYIKIFKAMKNLPVTIRYLDPPLHEFLPKTKEEKETLASELNIETSTLEKRIEELKEFNPMMGHRGVRLLITYPEIAIMQTKAIIDAITKLKDENIVPKVEIMIPLVSDLKEYLYIKSFIESEFQKINYTDYEIGTMIETPRACIISNHLAEHSSFFSFGTNDLTQMTYGFSRDDAEKFLNDYYTKNIFENNPFETVDKEGVLELVKIAVMQAKNINKNITLGVCGEHGGDPKSIELFYEVGLDYVSCSPYRIPIAKLAAAQSQLRNPRK